MQIDSKTLLCRYRYDALNRLVASTPSAQADTQRFYLKDRLTTEIQGAEQRSIMQHDDQLLAQRQRQSGTVEARLLATDHQRSVLNVLAAARRNFLAYTPYGHRPPENGLLSLLGFNGERPDPVTGCYLLGNGYRAFNPVLMRFNSPDSWSPFRKGGLNVYAYCERDPVNRSDRSGHLSTMWSLIKVNIKKIAQMGRSAGVADRTVTSTGQAVSQVIHAKPATALGAFSKFQTMPDITEQIVRYLPGKDMVSLASASKEMRATVYESAKPASQLLGSGVTLNSAARGNVEGILPRDAIPIRNFENVMEELMVRHHDLPSRFGPFARRPRRVE